MKYDDASWHYGGDFPDDLPIEAAGTHIGMFLSWCLLNGLGGALHEQDGSQFFDQLIKREITPGRHFLSACDEKLCDEDLNDEGNAFAQAYYASSNDRYLTDYSRSLGQGLLSFYHVPDSWESYDRLAPVITRVFEEWRSGNSRYSTAPRSESSPSKTGRKRTQVPDTESIPDEYGVRYPILESEPLWCASKNRTYRDNLKIRLQSLHEFLAANGMYTNPDREFPGPEEFTISRDALTEKGLTFTWKYLDGYFQLRKAEASMKYLQSRLREMEGST